MLRLAAILSLALAGAAYAAPEKAVVAGGCFWCVEADFEDLPGVINAVSGFSGGTTRNPTYKNYEGHLEAVEITFDNAKISYADLIAKFLRSVDVTDAGGQFCDRGMSYSTAIFATPDQKAAAEAAVAEAGAQLGAPIVTPVRPAARFWPAEEYHQNYAKSRDIILTRAGPKTKANAYKFYRKGCGRDARLREVWGNAAFPGK